MSTLKVFLIKADNGKEAVMRLPVDQHGGITAKGHQAVRARFYDGTLKRSYGIKYALNLEAYSNGAELVKAVGKYNNLII